jgi:chromosome transmission fidelity protein 8
MLRIGHHLLEGKIVSLPKPLAVLQRVCAPSSPTLGGDPDGDGDGDVDMQHGDGCDAAEDKSMPVAAMATTTTSYAIRTLIRKKIVFARRPTPIVGLSAKT